MNEAVADFSKSIELDDSYLWPLVCRGLTYFDQELYKEALGDFDKVLDADPTHSWCLAYRAHIYHSLEQYEEALLDISHADIRDPELLQFVAPIEESCKKKIVAGENHIV